MSNFFYVGFRYQVLHFLFNYCLLSLQINTMYPLCSNNVQLHYSGFSAWSRMISPYLDSPPLLLLLPILPSRFQSFYHRLFWNPPPAHEEYAASEEEKKKVFHIAKTWEKSTWEWKGVKWTGRWYFLFCEGGSSSNFET